MKFKALSLALCLLLVMGLHTALAHGHSADRALSAVDNPALRTRNAENIRPVVAKRLTQLKTVRDALRSEIQNVQNARSDFATARRNLKTATGNKSQFRRDLRIKAKNLLMRRNVQLRKKIKELRARGIEIADNAPEVQALDAIDTTIQATDDTNELVRQSKRIRYAWQKILNKALVARARALNQAFLRALEKGNRFVERFENRIVTLQANGKNTLPLERGLARVKTDLNKLGSIQQDLKAEFQSANTPKAKAKILYKAKKVLVRARHRLLKDFRLLRKLVRLYRLINQGATAAEVTGAQTEADAAIAEIESEASLHSVISKIDAEAEEEATASVEPSELDAQFPPTPDNGVPDDNTNQTEQGDAT